MERSVNSPNMMMLMEITGMVVSLYGGLWQDIGIFPRDKGKTKF